MDQRSAEFKDLLKIKKVRFQNTETPGARLDFSYGDTGEYFNLEHGKEYDLPNYIIKHINSKRTPVYENQEGPEAPPIVVGYENRFMCIPVNM
jgi:hypothetical protein